MFTRKLTKNTSTFHTDLRKAIEEPKHAFHPRIILTRCVRRWWEWIPRKKEWMIDDSSFAWLYVILYTTILPDVSASSGHDGIIKGECNTLQILRCE
jgi:hypothetical protein